LLIVSSNVLSLSSKITKKRESKESKKKEEAKGQEEGVYSKLRNGSVDVLFTQKSKDDRFNLAPSDRYRTTKLESQYVDPKLHSQRYINEAKIVVKLWKKSNRRLRVLSLDIFKNLLEHYFKMFHYSYHKKNNENLRLETVPFCFSIAPFPRDDLEKYRNTVRRLIKSEYYFYEADRNGKPDIHQLVINTKGNIPVFLDQKERKYLRNHKDTLYAKFLKLVEKQAKIPPVKHNIPIPEPPVDHKSCIVWYEKYENYFEHIQSAKHKKQAKSNCFKRDYTTIDQIFTKLNAEFKNTYAKPREEDRSVRKTEENPNERPKTRSQSRQERTNLVTVEEPINDSPKNEEESKIDVSPSKFQDRPSERDILSVHYEVQENNKEDQKHETNREDVFKENFQKGVSTSSGWTKKMKTDTEEEWILHKKYSEEFSDLEVNQRGVINGTTWIEGIDKKKQSMTKYMYGVNIKDKEEGLVSPPEFSRISLEIALSEITSRIEMRS
jgi:hypothetical protein